MRTGRTERPDGRRSWLVAIVGAVAMVFTFGTPMSYGIFRAPFSDAFGVSPLALSGAFAVMLFTFFIGSGLIGVFGVRVRARTVLLACSVATGALAPSLYVADSIVGLTAVFALLGLALGGTATLYIPLLMGIYSTEKDTAVVGVFNVAAGVAALAMPPLGTASVSSTGGFTVPVLLTCAVTVVGIWAVAAGTAGS